MSLQDEYQQIKQLVSLRQRRVERAVENVFRAKQELENQRSEKCRRLEQIEVLQHERWSVRLQCLTVNAGRLNDHQLLVRHAGHLQTRIDHEVQQVVTIDQAIVNAAQAVEDAQRELNALRQKFQALESQAAQFKLAIKTQKSQNEQRKLEEQVTGRHSNESLHG